VQPEPDRVRPALQVKHALDRLLAAVGLVVLSPAFAGIALWIATESGRPVILRQRRAGRNGRPFRMLKFRTMVPDAVEMGRRLSLGEDPYGVVADDPRITRSGRFLRRTSLDELPQLWNVLRGDMSLVGPRPALPSEVEQYDDWLHNRLKVKPGITGLWQVSGRAEASFADYVRYDLFYIRNWSLSLDLWIMWRTLRAVVTGEGAR
jgi:lipopolysaccharide/colanic/teichoic acid biosynthesis glycosyltransferase